ncbi:MAG: Acetyl-CoA carboxylase, carboxyltransferase component [Chloroflexi bacterium]|nr:MAG: Acetyl-CoA carboxylase, carboxyltransferase component [Chloroflexota bacterium]
MGGEERVDRQHREGKLTVRERIDALVDPGTFRELGQLAGSALYEDEELTSFTPYPLVSGLARVDGRQVAVWGNDFTVRGGSGRAGEAASKGKTGFLEELASEHDLPVFQLLDGAGANVEAINSMGFTYLPNSYPIFTRLAQLLNRVPVLTALMGNVAGGVAGQSMMSHFTVMPKNTATLFAAGPPVVKRALGHEITKEELGGSQVHVHESGAVDNEAEDEADALRQLRAVFSYLPDTASDVPPIKASGDPADRTAEELLTIVPRNRARPYSMHRLIELVVDNGEMFEIQPHFGRCLITSLTRINGMPMGIVANNPRVIGGALDADGARKLEHFLELCDLFLLPIVFFVDVPGFMVGKQAEAAGTIRQGMRALWVSQNLRVPTMAVHIRKCYGMAGNLTGNPRRSNYRIAWPSGEWGSIPIEGGVDAAFRREIANAPDPAAKRAEIEARFRSIASPFRTGEAFAVEDIIDPRETRRYLAEFLELAYRALPRLAREPRGMGVRP